MTYNHISIISLHICDFSSKSNGSIYYLYDCIVIFNESLSVFIYEHQQETKRPILAICSTFSRKSSEINLKR